jgi:hypothetical protein
MSNSDIGGAERPEISARYKWILLILMFLPLSGILARLHTANGAQLAGIGVALWLLAIVTATLSLGRLARSAKIPVARHLAAWTFEFAALCFVVVALTGALLRR